MGFADDFEGHLAERRTQRAASDALEDQNRRALDAAIAGFVERFAQAAEYLAAQGVRPLPVVTIHHALSSSRLERVWPFTTIDIGGLFLHAGEFSKGHAVHSHISSVAHRIRKNDWVIDTLYGMNFRGFQFATDTIGGDKLGDFAIVSQSEDSTSHTNAEAWLLKETEKRLRFYNEKQRLRG